MFLSRIEIENYRTFRHVELCFHESVNYIVGDNNIGKSNFLDLLSTTLSGCGFREGDFLLPERPIRVVYTLSLGDMGSEETVRLELVQEIHEVMPTLRNPDTSARLPLEYIRRMYYMPQTLWEAMRRSVSSAEAAELGRLFHTYLSSGEGEAARMQDVLSGYGIAVDLSGSAESASARLLQAIYGEARSDGSRSTAQLMLTVGAYILTKLFRKKESRAVPFEEIVMTGRDGRRYLPVLISIDEPECHLHPYLQRAVLAFLRRIMNNKEPFFAHILKQVLGIDGLDGQIFVVTHSTDALIDDYRAIIRLYRDGAGDVKAACGTTFHFDRELEKHLIMHFPEVKEALYARCAVLVEGETEYGSFGHFSRTLGVDFDYFGICLINARGESSISRISQLLRRFHVPSVALYDRDVISGQKPSPSVFYTDGLCYEMDVVKACLSGGKRRLLDEAVRDTGEGRTRVSSALIKKACQKLGLPRAQYPPKKLSHISDRDSRGLSFYYFAWLYGNKGVIIGRTLGLLMTEADIPPAFRRVIEAAVREAGKV